MATRDAVQRPDAAQRSGTYPAIAKAFHWITAVVVAVMLVSGFWMTYRGDVLNIWDALTNTLFSLHKTLGFALLWFIVLRLISRFVVGVPAPEPSLPRWQRVIAALNHWAMYALLIAMPLLGWTAASLFPALEVFGAFSLPALTAPDASEGKEMYATIAERHEMGAFIIIGLVSLHVLAVLYHRFVRRDGVLRRMWPGSR